MGNLPGMGAGGWTTLRIFTVAACILEVVVSVLDFFDFDVPRMILGVYAILFCILIVLAELKISLVFEYFRFLASPRARAIFIIFVGTMTFGQGKILGYIAGGVMIFDGIVTMVGSFVDKEGGTHLADLGQGTSSAQKGEHSAIGSHAVSTSSPGF